ncbi:hypothetical protein [Dokdonia sp. Hel_I_53]|uniref:DUF7935 family protein n=1 Tax=Dokdonia sp. Hel_I_53 TaxID=1566287 RepID=UPI00119B6C94|nr:hypothetical protein [Dokdonia sp. Hel_I_53]TVZ51042.1 hypothetical protein OD90_0178 [Dokdonia sp. Hel_I_53]
MTQDIVNLAFNLLPAIIVALVSYYFFNQYTKEQEGRRRFLLHQNNQKAALPQRLQAYERLTLFLERISPGKLLTRVKPYNEDPNDYESLLLRTIEEEFDHNLAQQIYVTQECWNVIRTSKSTTAAIIRKTNMSSKITTSDQLRETLLRDLIDKAAPSELGLEFIKQEVSEII